MSAGAPPFFWRPRGSNLSQDATSLAAEVESWRAAGAYNEWSALCSLESAYNYENVGDWAAMQKELAAVAGGCR